MKLEVPSDVLDSVLSGTDLPTGFQCIDRFASQPCDVSAVTAASTTAAAADPVLADIGRDASASTRSPHDRVYDHLCEFVARDEWPISTQVACYWCCHRFVNTPIGLPLRLVKDRFHVFGCFCSLPCAAAFAFGSNELRHDAWETYSLLNLLARRMGAGPNPVRLAPPRLALQKFGGHLDIEAFRAQVRPTVHLHSYPMVAQVRQLEELVEGPGSGAGSAGEGTAVPGTTRSSTGATATTCRQDLFVPVDADKLRLLDARRKLERRAASATTGAATDTDTSLASASAPDGLIGSGEEKGSIIGSSDQAMNLRLE
jgi:hypothetical protein